MAIVEHGNAHVRELLMSSRTAILVHGAWVNSRCWEHLRPRLEARGIACVAPDWPFKAKDVELLRAEPDPRLATLGLADIVEHYARIIRGLPEPPLLIGHSMGGLVVQMLLDRDLGRGAVSLCPAPPRGVLPIQPSVVRTSLPMLSTPFGWRKLMRMRFEQWRWGFVAPLPEDEQRASFERYVTPESGRIWFELGLSLANGQAGVEFARRDRPPLLLVAGSADRVTPCQLVRANHRAYRGGAELQVLEGRPHFVLGERDVDELADRIDRFAAPLWSSPPRRSFFTAQSPRRCKVAIVGGGPAGLACAAALAERDVASVVLEAQPEVGCSWRGHYDRLHLHTTRALSGLPGYPIPRAWGPWIAAQDFATYLERYARHHQLEVSVETPVHRIVAGPRGFRLDTPRGEFEADKVVIASGLNREPWMPAWPGRAEFGGRLLHSSEYRSPEPFRGREVLVVGSGNSGAEIALDLALAGARVRLAVRTGPNVLPRSILGLPTQVTGVVFGLLPARVMDVMVRVLQRVVVGDLTKLGLPRPPRGLFSQVERDHAIPIIDVGLLEQLRAGRVEPVAALERFAGASAILADQRRIEPEVVIAATGFRPNLQQLVEPSLALDEHGLPRLSSAAESLERPGLYFSGFLVSVGGVLRAIARQSERIAASIAAS